MEELRAGRWHAARDLLEHTGRDWALRTARSQVLAAVGAGSDVVAAWRAEEFDSFDAAMMQARVAVVRALRAHRERRRDRDRLVHRARLACWDASRAWDEDPVPWIGLINLAQIDVRQLQPGHREPPWELLLPEGPWNLLREVYQRDPYNREAWLRMMQVFLARDVPVFDFLRWMSTWAPHGSDLLVMPLYAYVEDYRRARDQRPGKGRLLYWTNSNAAYFTDRALRLWFDFAAPQARSPVDLNHLAHALHAGGFTEGAEVFAAIGPYVTPAPWQDVTEGGSGWEETFVRARSHYLNPTSHLPRYTGRPR
jgi:hypothetical protein